jgi:bacterioferritin (cytochrome b1)
LKKEARSRARQIDYLGGDPTVKAKEAEYSDNSKTMLEIDLTAEQKTIKNYRERKRENYADRTSWRICPLKN